MTMGFRDLIRPSTITRRPSTAIRAAFAAVFGAVTALRTAIALRTAMALRAAMALGAVMTLVVDHTSAALRAASSSAW